MIGHLVFDGPGRKLKLWVREAPGAVAQLRQTIDCHDVGVADGTVADPYGHNCKCPPGMFFVGQPQPCASRNPNGTATQNHADDAAYGCWFTPLTDDPIFNAFSMHGRAGIGIHGGGSDLPDPFAPQQGWEYTHGCLRVQNADNERVLVPFIDFIRRNSADPDHSVTLTVSWGDRGT
jgi:hypothetical protein